MSSKREKSFGQDYQLTLVDKFGIWLSRRMLSKIVKNFDGLTMGDFGCGYYPHASLSLLDRLNKLILVDVAICKKLSSSSPNYSNYSKLNVYEGSLTEVLPQIPAASIDVIYCNSVLEHLPRTTVLSTIKEMKRLLSANGYCLINVPSWRGKFFLEASAFHFHLSPKSEMDDHKMYYDIKDLWPILIEAGFLPSKVKCFYHKFGLNTFAICTQGHNGY